MTGYYRKLIEGKNTRLRETKDRFLSKRVVLGLLAVCVVYCLVVERVSAHEVSPQGEKVVISVEVWEKGSQNTIWGIVRDALITYTDKEPTDAQIVDVINQTSKHLKPIFGTKNLDNIGAGEYSTKVVELFRELNIKIKIPKVIPAPVQIEKKPIKKIVQKNSNQKKIETDASDGFKRVRDLINSKNLIIVGTLLITGLIIFLFIKKNNGLTAESEKSEKKEIKEEIEPETTKPKYMLSFPATITAKMVDLNIESFADLQGKVRFDHFTAQEIKKINEKLFYLHCKITKDSTGMIGLKHLYTIL